MKRIEVYSKPNCVACNATKKKLGKHGVIYDLLDAREHIDTLKALGHMSAPVVVVYDEGDTVVDHWDGYRPERVAGLAATPAPADV